MNRKSVTIINLLLIAVMCVSITSCERKNKPLASVISPAEETPEPEPEPENGLLAEVYIPDFIFRSLPDFDKLTPVQSVTAPNIDLADRPGDDGFAELGIDLEEAIAIQFAHVARFNITLPTSLPFAIRFSGRLMVENPGTHLFKIQSDDGAQVYINGELIVDNDGPQAFTTATGSAMLTPGLHDIEIRYYQGFGGIGLRWFWQPPDSPEEIVPPEVLYLPEEE